MQSEIVLSSTGADAITESILIQSLWSGYGQIVRLNLIGGYYPSVVLKHVVLSDVANHPRGWNTDVSHQRKIRSYQVEAHWYQHYASRCDSDCMVPSCLALNTQNNETVLVLTDLDAAGFNARKTEANIDDIYACLTWLANFHATFLNSKAGGLWECGTYWHLDTRPDELAALSDEALRQAAPFIDLKLKQCRHQTLVHGDAKLANFCFRSDNELPKVAAVDFQYIGKGCGMKDVAYFIGSCLNEDECEEKERHLLDFYFSVLVERVRQKKKGVDIAELEQEWRQLYPVAWADFHRFMKGWSPGHWKIHRYSNKLTASVIKSFQL